MKKIISLVLALTMVLSLLPVQFVQAEDSMPDSTTTGMSDSDSTSVSVTGQETTITAVSIENIELLAGYHGFWEGNHFVYYLYNTDMDFSSVPIQLTLSDGTQQTVLSYGGVTTYFFGEWRNYSLSFDFNGERKTIEWSDPQSEGNIWLAGNTYSITGSVDTTIPATLIYNVVDGGYVSSFTTDDIWVDENQGKWNYSGATPWFEYDIQPSFRVEMSDGMVYENQAVFNYGIYNQMICENPHCVIEQSESNPWEPGTYTVHAYLLGKETTFNVHIMPTQIEEVGDVYLTLFEKTFGDQYSEAYFHYNLFNNGSMDALSVTDIGQFTDMAPYSHGYEQWTSDGNYVYRVYEYQGRYHTLQFKDPQSDMNAWIVGNQYSIPAKFGKFDTTITFEVVENDQIQNISVDPVYCRYGVDGWESPDPVWNENTQQWENPTWNEDLQDWEWHGVFLYNYEPSQITVTLKDGRVITGDQMEIRNQLGGNYYCTSDQSSTNQWDMGEHTASLTLFNTTINYPVFVVEELPDNPGNPDDPGNPGGNESSFVQSLEISPMSVMEGTNGYPASNTALDGSVEYYWQYDPFYAGMDYITVTYKDGNVYYGNRQSIYEQTGYWIDYYLEQYENHWGPGNHEFTISLDGVTATGQMEILESTVESIWIPSNTFIENTNGYLNNVTDEFGIDHSYWDYNISPSTVTVNFKDGTSFTGEQWELYNTYGYSVDTVFYQNWDQPMVAGNTYTAVGFIAGHRCDYQITIQENPIDYIEVEPISIVEETNGGTAYDRDEFGVEHSFWRYGIPEPESIRVHFKDGRVFSGTSWELFNQTGYNYYVEEPYQSWRDPMTAGNTYYATVVFMGARASLPVTIVANPTKIVDFEVEPLCFEKMTNGIWDSFVDPVSGEEETYAYWKYKLNNTVRFTFILADGTRMTDTYSSLYNQYGNMTGNWISYEPIVTDNQDIYHQWDIGMHSFNVNVAGIYKVIPVEISEGIIKDVELHSFSVTQGTHGNFLGTGGRFVYSGTDLITLTFIDDTTFTASKEAISLQYPHALDTLVIERIPEDFPYLEQYAAGVHELTYHVLGKTKTYTLTIIPTAEQVDRIEAAPLAIKEYTHGRYCNEQWPGMWYFDYVPNDTACTFIYDLRHMLELTVYFKDGTTISGSIDEIGRKLQGGLMYSDDQAIGSPWKPGTHNIELTFGGGQSYSVQVDIVETDVESISVNPMTVIGPLSQDVFRIDQFHVVFKDGTTYDGPLEALDSKYLIVDSYFWSEEPGTYTSKVWCMGQLIEFEYTIVVNPITWIELPEITLSSRNPLIAVGGIIHYNDGTTQEVLVQNGQFYLYYQGIEYYATMITELPDLADIQPGDVYTIPLHIMRDTYNLYVHYEEPPYTSLTINGDNGLTLTFGLPDGTSKVMHAVEWNLDGEERSIITDAGVLNDVIITCDGEPLTRRTRAFRNVQIAVNGVISNVLEECSWFQAQRVMNYLMVHFNTDMFTSVMNEIIDYHGVITNDIIDDVVFMVANFLVYDGGVRDNGENQFITKQDAVDMIHRYFGDVVFDIDACTLFDASGIFCYSPRGGGFRMPPQTFVDDGKLYVNGFSFNEISSFIINGDGTIAHMQKVDCSGRKIVTLADGTKWYAVRGYIQLMYNGIVEENGKRYTIANGKVVSVGPGLVNLTAVVTGVEEYTHGHYEWNEGRLEFYYELDYLVSDDGIVLHYNDGSEKTIQFSELYNETGGIIEHLAGISLELGSNVITYKVGTYTLTAEINVVPTSVREITAETACVFFDQGNYLLNDVIVVNVEYTDGRSIRSRLDDFLTSRRASIWGPIAPQDPQQESIVLEIEGLEVEIPVDICENPVASIQFADITLMEGIDGYYVINAEGDREFHYYFAGDNMNETPVPKPVVYLKDGTLGEVVQNGYGYSLRYKEKDYHILSFHELNMQASITEVYRWKTGETHVIKGEALGVRWSFKVKTVKSEFIRLQIAADDGLTLTFTRMDGSKESMKVLSFQGEHFNNTALKYHTLVTDKKIFQSVQIYIDGERLDSGAMATDIEKWVNSGSRIRIGIGNLLSNEIDSNHYLIPETIMTEYVYAIMKACSEYIDITWRGLVDTTYNGSVLTDPELMLKVVACGEGWWTETDRAEAEATIEKWFGKKVDVTTTRYYHPDTDTISVFEAYVAFGLMPVDTFYRDDHWIVSMKGIYVFLDQYGRIASFDTMKEANDGIYTLSDGNDWYIVLGELQHDYTGYVDINGESYYIVNGIVSEAPQEPEEPENTENVIQGCSLTLNGDIGLNFYVHISKELMGTDAYVTFTQNGVVSSPILLKEALHSGDLYKFTWHVAAKEMRDEVILRLFDENGNEVTMFKGEEVFSEGYSFSVESYGRLVQQSSEVSNELKELIDAMLNYGMCAQQYFKYGSYSEVVSLPELNANDLEQWEMVQIGHMEGLMYYGSSLLLRETTAIRHYFMLEKGLSVDSYRFEVNGMEIDPVQRGNRYYIEIADIEAQNLDQMPKLTVTGVDESEVSLYYGPMTYAYSVLCDGSSSDTMKNLMISMKLYSEKAEEYFG